jgi:hypothetical protein
MEAVVSFAVFPDADVATLAKISVTQIMIAPIQIVK